MRSMKMFVNMNSKFQCANTTCLPFVIIVTSNVLGCEVACLMRSQCKAATFYRSITICQLFNDIIDLNGNMLIHTDATSMSVINGTRFPSESISTQITTTTTTTSTTTTATTTTTTTTSTTSTTTTSTTTTSTRTTSTTATTTTTTTTTSTTTTAVLKNPGNNIQWLFDGNLNDVYGNYNGQLFNTTNVTWMSPGYAGYGSAIRFTANSYMIINRDLNLSSVRLTVSAWIWLPNTLSSNVYFPLFSYCPASSTDMCLHMIIKNTIFLGYFSDDLTGSTVLKFNQWYHVAFIHDPLLFKQSVYLNGILNGIRVPNSPFHGNANYTTIGAVPLLSGFTLQNGFIDKLTFAARIKNTSELLDEATLVAYFSFDNTYNDNGPNQMIKITFISTSFDSQGRFNQCLLLNNLANLSYFQIDGLYYLGQTNYSYSFSLWIYPFNNNGTILQVSSTSWCIPMIGYDSFGHLTIQTKGLSGIYSITYTSGTILLNQWTNIILTYSNTNGLQLFLNGLFINGYNSDYSYSASNNSLNTIILGNSITLNNCSSSMTQIVPSQFQGKIDEFKIFSRELSLDDITELAQGTTYYTYGSSSLWKFDNNTFDSLSNLNGTAINSPSYIASGITGNGYALKLIRNNNQYVTISTYKNFANVSFTVEMWIYPTSLSNNIDYGLFSQYGSSTTDNSLHLIIRNNILLMGFYADDLPCTTTLSINTWYHVAFVYDYRSRSQLVYLNGNQDCLRTSAGPFLGTSGSIYIGTFMLVQGNFQYFDGYIDNVELNMRVKTNSEILTDATLTTWHSFDNISLIDSGPLGLTRTYSNVTLVPGKVNQALSFNSSLSFYQVSGFVLLGIPNNPYSMSLWVTRTSTGGGILIHLSTQTNGTGWCAALMGFRSTGEIIVINWYGGTGTEIVGPILSINIWIHIAMTYSPTNGLILYINGINYGTTGSRSYGAPGQNVFLTLGNFLGGTSCNKTSITSDPYVGYLDEFRVYSRELSAADVYGLANP
ncbi:unnamed protein product [Adineta ricciae]|uniref:LamG-like jellyroll fold domain-containing protein n=1 Tax=Adineta ricciae TaxID=249248 RepID=A0A815VRI8_ADIRI|nr:unnamed protein product [Adineta ricciae]